jgi:hypothetical protein
MFVHKTTCRFHSAATLQPETYRDTRLITERRGWDLELWGTARFSRTLLIHFPLQRLHSVQLCGRTCMSDDLEEGDHGLFFVSTVWYDIRQ